MRKRNRGLIAAIIVLSLALSGLILFAVTLRQAQADPTEPMLQDSTPADPSQDTTPVPSTAPSTLPSTAPTTEPATEPTTEPTTVPTEPPVVKVSTATLGATGDILMHGPVINSGLTGNGSYDYSSIFTYFTSYVSGLDYAVANMEGTLAGTENGYGYSGYPNFNAPDAIAEGLKNAGFDMLLTANNHSYDTRSAGFHRTQEVIDHLGMAHTGTVTSQEEDNFIVADVNGIQIGMICYTYNTGISDKTGTSTLNDIPLSEADNSLVNSFDYEDLESFYAKLSGQLEEMELAGAEALVMFIHWGDEYRLSPNSYQKQIAQKLCDLGIDVIIGGHSHVVQPMELLTSTTDEAHKTVCLYSLGNAVSNQRQGLISSISTAHTEDGLLMSVRFAKYSDGTVLVEAVELLPTWVNMYYSDSSRVYQILPLDTAITDWKSAFSLTDSQLTKAQASYDRTMALVSEGLADANAWLSSRQAAIEATLGVNQ